MEDGADGGISGAGSEARGVEVEPDEGIDGDGEVPPIFVSTFHSRSSILDAPTGAGAHTFGFTGPPLKNSARRDCMPWRCSGVTIGSRWGMARGERSLPSRRSRTPLMTKP